MRQKLWAETCTQEKRSIVFRVESYSSLSTLAACAEKYRLSYVEALDDGETIEQTNGKAMAAALRVLYSGGWGGADARRPCVACEGSGRDIFMGGVDNMDINEIDCASCYGTGVSEDETNQTLLALDALRAEWGDTRPPLGHKKSWLTRAFAEARLEAYVEERNARPTILETAEVISAYTEEMHAFKWTHEGAEVTLRGAPDLVIRDGGRVFVVDHKTTGGWITDHFFLRFSLGFQLRIYAAMYQELTGEEVHGGIVNAIYCGEKALDPPEAWKKRKSAPSRPHRIPFTQEQILDTHKQVLGLVLQRDHHYATGTWPRNEHACDDFGGCSFLELCKAPSEAARKARMMTSFRRKEDS